MKDVKTIVFPTDFSSKSDEALDYAAALAVESKARLLIVHVEEPPTNYGEGLFYYGVPDPDRDALRGMLSRLKPRNSAVPYQHHFLQGNPADEIVALAKKESADLIVMSSHGRSGLSRLVMGSIAEQVMRRAECPVLVVKPHTVGTVAAAAGSVA